MITDGAEQDGPASPHGMGNFLLTRTDVSIFKSMLGGAVVGGGLNSKYVNKLQGDGLWDGLKIHLFTRYC